MDLEQLFGAKPDDGTQNENTENTIQSPQDSGESSLHDVNNENKVEDSVAETTQVDTTSEVNTSTEDKPYEIQEADVLKYLSGQLGEEYSSLDSIKEKISGSNQSLKFASEEIEQYNKFHQETGLGYDAFSFVRSVSDLDKIDAKDAIMADMTLKYGNILSQEEIEFKYNQKYGKVEIDEDEMTDEEIEKYNRENRAKETDLKLDAVEAKKRLGDLASQYKETKREVPQQSEEPEFNFEEFKSISNKQLQEMEELSFEDANGNEIFNFPLTEERRAKYLDNIPTPQEFINEFFDSEGNLDMNQYIAYQVMKNEIDNIIMAAQSQKASIAEENVIKEMSNVTLDEKQIQTPEGKPKQTLAEFFFKQR